MSFIPVCEPTLQGNELIYVKDAVESTWISSRGSYLDRFQQDFASKVDRNFGVATPNGTQALHLGLTSMGISKGDEVIMPNFTMIACAAPICYQGAIPVFVDAEKETWNIDPALIEGKITRNTKAIMIVHIYGHPCDMDPILEIAKKYDLLIIEDFAEAIGGTYKGRTCGSFGEVSCVSFFANKNITTGEGGMVLTNSKDIHHQCLYLKDLAFPVGERSYFHEDLGFNYRMSNIHAAIGLAQLEKLDEYGDMRRKNAHLYNNFLSDVPGVTTPVEKSDCRNVYWMYSIVINPEEYGMGRDSLMNLLKENGIGSRKFFVGMHRQPVLHKHGCDVSGEYPVSDWLSENGLYLPSSSHLSEDNIKNISSIIAENSDS